MKKNLLILFTLCITSLGYSQTVGDTFVDNFIFYEITSLAPNNIEAVGYDTAGGSVLNIPATVTFNSNTYSVTQIAAFAFSNKSLTGVTLPNSITTIGSAAFQSNQLTSITFPNSVSSIGSGAFGFNELASITFPNNITTIADSAFKNNQLTDITIPDTVTSILDEAFRNNLLTTIIIPSNVTNISSEVFLNNLLNAVTSLAVLPPSINSSTFGDRSGINLTIPAGTTTAYTTAQWTGFNTVTEDFQVGDTFVDNFITYEITSTTNNTVTAIDYNVAGGLSVNIPPSVTNNGITYNLTEIGINAFRDYDLTAVTIPVGVTTLGQAAFAENELTSIIIPEGISESGTSTFSNNELTSITFPNSLTTINDNSFKSNSLQNVSIPNSVTSIGTQAFLGNDLISATLSENLLEMGQEAFANNALTTIVIPDSVTTLGEEVFIDNQLTSITISTSVTFINNGVFAANQLTIFTIPDNVTSIGDGAFSNNQLTEVTFSENITSIGKQAFLNNPLTNVFSESLTPPMIFTGGNDDTFGDRSGIDLFIPADTFNVYVTDAGALWTGFNSVTEDSGLVQNFITYEVISTSNNTIAAIDYDTAGGTAVFIPGSVIFDSINYTVTSIGDQAFLDKQLTNITLSNTIQTIGAQAFSSNNITSVTIPDNVASIENAAFQSNQLTSVTIPANVTSIGANAFALNQLNTVISEAVIPPIIVTSDVEDTFGDRSVIDLFIPAGTFDSYVSDPGALWTGFNSVTDQSLSVANETLLNEVTITNTASELQVLTSNTAPLKSYIIYSLTGAKIQEGTAYTITIDTLSKGVYVLQLIFDTGIFVQKFVK